jgi:hypothetical protein
MSKKGQPWSKEEEETMLSMLRKGETIDSVAGLLQRTSKAILWRLGLYCQKIVRTRKRTLEQLSDEFNCSIENLRDVMDQLEMQHGGGGGTNSNSSSTANGNTNQEILLVLKTIQDDISTINTRTIRINKNMKKLQEDIDTMKKGKTR